MFTVEFGTFKSGIIIPLFTNQDHAIKFAETVLGRKESGYTVPEHGNWIESNSIAYNGEKNFKIIDV